nr:lysophospholipid acyltransferase family protein [uncultured Rhodopila sp.]
MRRIDQAVMRPFRYLGRLLGTGVAFAFIFFGGGVLAITLLPVLATFPGRREKRARLAIHRAFRIYIASLRLLKLIELRTYGLEKLGGATGRMMVANHPTLLDVVLLIAVIPNAQCIIKHQLWDHRFLGPLMRAAGYIRNDLPPDELVAACRQAFDEGDCLIIFPEGTRTVPGAKLRFRRGFANLAIMTGVPLQPVTITCDPPTLIKGESWWKLPPRTPLFKVSVGDFLDPALYTNCEYRSLSARRLVRVLEAHYAKLL